MDRKDDMFGLDDYEEVYQLESRIARDLSNKEQVQSETFDLDGELTQTPRVISSNTNHTDRESIHSCPDCDDLPCVACEPILLTEFERSLEQAINQFYCEIENEYFLSLHEVDRLKEANDILKLAALYNRDKE